MYHINAADPVTQWQVVDCVGKISEQHPLPVIAAMLRQFPFRIVGFHSDNGSEFINHGMDNLLKSLLIEFTNSADRSTDSALVESKNGAIIRKHIGYGHIAAEHAEAVHARTFIGHADSRPPVWMRGQAEREYKREGYAPPYEKCVAGGGGV